MNPQSPRKPCCTAADHVHQLMRCYHMLSIVKYTHPVSFRLHCDSIHYNTLDPCRVCTRFTPHCDRCQYHALLEAGNTDQALKLMRSQLTPLSQSQPRLQPKVKVGI